MSNYLRRTSASSCTLILLSLAAGFHSSAQQLPYIVAQSDYGGQNGNTGGVTRGYPWAQTSTATRSGTLFNISAGFYAPQPGLDPYYIYQFRDTTPAGAPAAQVLATVNVPTDFLTNAPGPYGYGWVDLTADFSSFGIPLSAGHKYALSIDVPGPVGTTIYNAFFWGLTGSGYAGGDPYAFGPDGAVLVDSHEDFLFTVEAVPEPSLAPLTMALCAWVLRTRKR